MEGLTKNYPGFCLDHISFSVPKGMIVGLIGENGAGKTTTINLILHAIEKDSGKILVFGKDHLQFEKEIKQEIGVVQDECNPVSYTHLDVYKRQMYVCPYDNAQQRSDRAILPLDADPLCLDTVRC